MMMSGFVPVSSSSSSWIGHKRGREEDDVVGVGVGASSSHQDMNTIHRNIADFRLPTSHGNSSSSAPPQPPQMQTQQPPFVQFQGTSDLLRDYYQYSQILKGSGDFQGLEQWFYESQMAAIHSSSSFLSSSPSLSLSSSSSSTQFSPSSQLSSVSLPLFPGQQMEFFRPPEDQSRSGGYSGGPGGFHFPPSWSDSGGYHHHPPPPPPSSS
ncbi:hypothetical protein TSUD_42780 [Trifolium subterraneum]|uniref:Uncharacterized protein n=1 Tax=Trifolium subterraneum TaxID=3900 RepID=A0A2Z6LW52_TRISU|nr:hypothetical protein TSUD_42780 [Trifolium subterraneum]